MEPIKRARRLASVFGAFNYVKCREYFKGFWRQNEAYAQRLPTSGKGKSKLVCSKEKNLVSFSQINDLISEPAYQV